MSVGNIKAGYCVQFNRQSLCVLWWLTWTTSSLGNKPGFSLSKVFNWIPADHLFSIYVYSRWWAAFLSTIPPKEKTVKFSEKLNALMTKACQGLSPLTPLFSDWHCESHRNGLHLIISLVGESPRMLQTVLFKETPKACHFNSHFFFALWLYCSHSTSCLFRYRKGWQSRKLFF